MKMQFRDGNVGLKPFEPIDLEKSGYREWLLDEDVTKYLVRGRFPLTENDIIQNFAKIDRKEKIEWSIYWLEEENKKAVHIGNISLENLNFIDSNAEIIIMIGEKDFWNKGIGTKAFEIIIKYASTRLGIHRLYAGTHQHNRGMQKIFMKCNMLQEGVKKHSFKYESLYFDTVHYYYIPIEL